MRDRNSLSFNQFNIQLSEKVLSSSSYSKSLKLEKYFSHNSCLWRSKTENFNLFEVNSVWKTKQPLSYRLTRALAISVWFFPEEIKWLYLLDLWDRDFSQFNEKQRIEIQILLSSKEEMLSYLYLTERYSANEIFGNLLGNDQEDLAVRLKVKLEFPKPPQKKVFRRGPKDKGSRRSDSSVSVRIEEEQVDATFGWISEEIKKLNKREYILQSTVKRIQKVLRTFLQEQKDSST